MLWPQARAVHFDGETLRTFLAISLGEPVFALASRWSGGLAGHLAGGNTFTYFDDPNGSTMEYTTELKALYDTRPGRVRPVGPLEPGERVGQQADVQRPR